MLSVVPHQSLHLQICSQHYALDGADIIGLRRDWLPILTSKSSTQICTVYAPPADALQNYLETVSIQLQRLSAWLKHADLSMIAITI